MSIKYDSSIIDHEQIDFYDYSIVEMNYIEMSRQCDRIETVFDEVYALHSEMKLAMTELANLINYPLTFNFDDFYLQYRNIHDTVNTMRRQISQYKELNSEIGDSLNAVIRMVENYNGTEYNQALRDTLVFSDYMYESGEHLLISGKNEEYKELLARQQRGEILTEDENDTIENATVDSNDWFSTGSIEVGSSSSKYKSLYDWIEKNKADEMKTVGAKTGEEYFNKYLEYATRDCTDNRDKAVKSAIAYNSFLVKNDLKVSYVLGGSHVENPEMNNIVNSSDCSSYVTTLIKQGNPNFDGGTTGTIANSEYTHETTRDNIRPGDIIYQNGYSHVLFVLDKTSNGELICCEESSSNNDTALSVKALDSSNYWNQVSHYYTVDYNK